jgi:hypothetical protein
VPIRTFGSASNRAEATPAISPKGVGRRVIRDRYRVVDRTARRRLAGWTGAPEATLCRVASSAALETAIASRTTGSAVTSERNARIASGESRSSGGSGIACPAASADRRTIATSSARN